MGAQQFKNLVVQGRHLDHFVVDFGLWLILCLWRTLKLGGHPGKITPAFYHTLSRFIQFTVKCLEISSENQVNIKVRRFKLLQKISGCATVWSHARYISHINLIFLIYFQGCGFDGSSWVTPLKFKIFQSNGDWPNMGSPRILLPYSNLS